MTAANPIDEEYEIMCVRNAYARLISSPNPNSKTITYLARV